MSLNKDSQRGDVFLGSQPTPGKPKGLLDAISEIQQYYVVERSGSTIPVDFFTLAGKLAFFEVGFKGAFISGLVSAFLTPIAIGVIERYLPIFGSYDPTFYDKCFAFLIAIGFTVGYAFFFAVLGKYYIGEISKAAIKNLIMGLVAGAILKLVIAFLAFHFIYFVVLEPHNLAVWLLKMRWLIQYYSLNKLYQWLQDFRPVFLISAYFVAFTTSLLVTIPVAGIFLGARKTTKLMNQENEWK
ncbi:MAG: hypothetical protein M0P16_00300 [Syntrophales bacterium]|jgi:hypothetical protein|nr:hypothetical protein [Syntrophales bacterium]